MAAVIVLRQLTEHERKAASVVAHNRRDTTIAGVGELESGQSELEAEAEMEVEVAVAMVAEAAVVWQWQ